LLKITNSLWHIIDRSLHLVKIQGWVFIKVSSAEMKCECTIWIHSNRCHRCNEGLKTKSTRVNKNNLGKNILIVGQDTKHWRIAPKLVLARLRNPLSHHLFILQYENLVDGSRGLQNLLEE